MIITCIVLWWITRYCNCIRSRNKYEVHDPWVKILVEMGDSRMKNLLRLDWPWARQSTDIAVCFTQKFGNQALSKVLWATSVKILNKWWTFILKKKSTIYGTAGPDKLHRNLNTFNPRTIPVLICLLFFCVWSFCCLGSSILFMSDNIYSWDTQSDQKEETHRIIKNIFHRSLRKCLTLMT